MKSFLLFLLFSATVSAFSYSRIQSRLIRNVQTQLNGARQRAWAKGDLSDKDIFEGDNDDPSEKKGKTKLETETVFYDGPPSPSEIIFPAISIVTVIGIVPFISALTRQFWVRYKFTSRRISIQSGFGGNTQSDIIYPDIDEIRYVYRSFGGGDMVLFLKDGAKVELRFVPNFDETLKYILGKCDDDCRSKTRTPVEKSS